MAVPVRGQPAEYIIDLGRRLIAELAADELPLFEPIADGFLDRPKAVVNDRPRPGAALGSGVDTFVALVTPVALLTATAVYQHLVERAGAFTVARTIQFVRELRKHRRGDLAIEPSEAGPPALTPELRAELTTGTRQLVEELTHDPDLADRCAAAVLLLLDGQH